MKNVIFLFLNRQVGPVRSRGRVPPQASAACGDGCGHRKPQTAGAEQLGNNPNISLVWCRLTRGTWGTGSRGWRGRSTTASSVACSTDLHCAELGCYTDEFMAAIKLRWPTALIQFEDFQSKHAVKLLARYKREYLMFNDDIQVNY